MSEDTPVFEHRWRLRAMLAVLCCVALVLAWRCVDLQVVNNDFLKQQARAIHLRSVPVRSHRGNVLDRNGQPLAVSTPVESVYANPKKVNVDDPAWKKVVSALGLAQNSARDRILRRSTKDFVYLYRQVTPQVAKRVREAGAEGVGLIDEFQRFYPAAHAAAHVVGFTSIDDRGLEGVEFQFDHALQGTDGREQVLIDGDHRRRKVVETVQVYESMKPGEELVLSIDQRVQYFAFRALLGAVKRYRARAATAVVLDVRTGEILAMVSQPSFNPNNRSDRASAHVRNRAVTDQFEPGSTLKPFTVAAALSSGMFTADSRIDTSPGHLKVRNHTIRDHHNLGEIDLTTVIKKSSNVGASKLALAVGQENLWRTLDSVGFGQPTALEFPGATSGVLAHHFSWSEVQGVTLSFGYGIGVSALQLARAYAAIGNKGVLPEVTLLKREDPPRGEQVMPRGLARTLLRMLETVVSAEGTGSRAAVHGYRIGGKTGTVRKPIPGGYSEDRYLALFAGLAPLSRPRLSIVVMVDEPSGKAYYGGQVAAPVFAEVAAGALRVLGVAPDGDGPGREASGRRLARAPATAESTQ